MDNEVQKKPIEKQYSLRLFTLFSLVFFLVISVLTALVVVPRINAVFESQNAKDVSVDLALEVELFKKYVESKRTILQDLAKFPSLVNAAMLSDSSNPVLIDLFENVVIGGESARLVLQDIAGSVLIKTASNLQGSYNGKQNWLDRILDGTTPYHFQLLGQKNSQITFKISIPVKFKGFIEGVLSAEINVPMDELFVARIFDDHIAFKLVQDEVTVFTDMSLIEIIKEHSVDLELPNLTFVYITDAGIIKEKERKIRNTVLSVLLAGLTISFLLFAWYGYRSKSVIEKTGYEKPLFSEVFIIPIMIAVIGIAGSTTAFWFIHTSQKNSIENELTAFGKQNVRDIQDNLNSDFEFLTALAAFFYSSSTVDRTEFDSFTQPFVHKSKNIQALGWVPKVSGVKRVAYEDEAKSDGLSDFSFRELDAIFEMQTASNREQYFPAFYISPSAGNESIFGLDLASDQQQLKALTDAAWAGSLTATSPINLKGENEIHKGILVLYPVYEKEKDKISYSDGQFGAVKGFVLLVLRTEDTFGDILSINKDTMSSIHVQDVSDSNSKIKIYGEAIPSNEITHSQTIYVAGRTWELDIAGQTREHAMPWFPWLILAAGLIISALATIGLTHLIRRREMVELLVTKRTAELRTLSSIAANSNDIFIVTKADKLSAEEGGPEIIYVNEAFTRFTGFSFDEAVGQTPRILQGEKTDRNQLDLIKRSLAEGKPFQGEIINYTKNNVEYWVDVNIIPLKDEAGEIIQYAAVQRDITDRVGAQIERESLIEKLTDSNEELARFAFVCSHDLQEPLRMIRSFSEKLQAHISDDLINDEKGQKYFRFITDGAARAQQLIQDILSYSSIGTDTEQLQSIDVDKMIAGIRDAMSAALDNCEGVITSDDLPELQGNRTQLFQLFQNLINNATKYQKPGAAPVVHVGVADAGDFWKFSISDNGIGMEERHLHKIFDVFQRLHGKGQYAGTGVGLSICKKVVERHGGKLWVESEYGVGSTFYFTLLKPIIEEVIDERERKAS